MRVVIFGATGVVGKGVLLGCLDDARVEHVLLVSRHRTDVSHPKIREIVHADFTAFENLTPAFADIDACFYCLGVTAVGLSEGQYHHLTLAAATALASASARRLTFCYVSGEGADSTEHGRTMWARVTGKPRTRCYGFRSRRPSCFGRATCSRYGASDRRRAGTKRSTT
jgi:uncharacterized protein YbjT (DUF2867 family)